MRRDPGITTFMDPDSLRLGMADAAAPLLAMMSSDMIAFDWFSDWTEINLQYPLLPGAVKPSVVNSKSCSLDFLYILIGFDAGDVRSHVDTLTSLV